MCLSLHSSFHEVQQISPFLDLLFIIPNEITSGNQKNSFVFSAQMHNVVTNYGMPSVMIHDLSEDG